MCNSGLGRLEDGEVEVPCMGVEITCRINRNDRSRCAFGNFVHFFEQLERRLFALAGLAGRLLLGFVGIDLFGEITFTAAAAGRPEAVDA